MAFKEKNIIQLFFVLQCVKEQNIIQILFLHHCMQIIQNKVLFRLKVRIKNYMSRLIWRQQQGKFFYLTLSLSLSLLTADVIIVIFFISFSSCKINIFLLPSSPSPFTANCGRKLFFPHDMLYSAKVSCLTLQLCKILNETLIEICRC